MRRYTLRDDQWDRFVTSCQGTRDGSVSRRRTTERSSKPCCTATVPASLGSTCLSALVTGKTSIAGSAAGLKPVCGRVFQHLAADADNEYAMIDSTIVRAHQHSAGAKKSRRGSGHRSITGPPEH